MDSRPSILQALAACTAGTVALAMVGAAAVQFRSDAGLVGVVVISCAFLAVAILLLIGAARRGRESGWSPTFYALASTILVILSLLILMFAWGDAGVSGLPGTATKDVLILAVVGEVFTVAATFIPRARRMVK